MPDDNDVIGEIVSCDSLYIAPVLEDSEANYTTGTPEYLAPVGEIKHDPKVNVASSSYDGVIMFNYLNEGASEDAVTVSGLSEKRKAEITGKSYDSATGMIYDNGDLVKTPLYALGYRIEIGTGSYIYHWLLKGKFYLSGAMDAKSKGEKTEPQATELTFLPVRTIHKWDVPDPSDATGVKKIHTGLKRTVGDTSDSAFTLGESWFNTVVIPGTTAVDALALSSSNPADDAAGVLATTHPTLTFNNKIASDDVLVIKTSDNSIAAITKSYDTTGKILTITPSADFTSAAAYQIVVTGVKDIYGQSLAPSVINFTVA